VALASHLARELRGTPGGSCQDGYDDPSTRHRIRQLASAARRLVFRAPPVGLDSYAEAR
jgi:hypothetical protein